MWQKILKNYQYNNCIFFSKNISDLDQCFKYEYPLIDTKLEFNFSIQYIRKYFYKCYTYFPVITLTNYNGYLMYGDSICKYTFYNIKECNSDYEDLNDIFVTPFPTNPLEHIVIDGNHRVSLQINEGIRDIHARYCPFEISERSLISSFQVALYSCLFDCAFIQHNVDKISDLQIKKHLKIFNTFSFVNNIEERKSTDKK